MNPVVIPAQRWKYLLYVLLYVVFVGPVFFGRPLLLKAGVSPTQLPDPPGYFRVFLWVTMAFAAFFLVMAVLGVPKVVLNDAGVTLVPLLPGRTVPWADIRRVEVVPMGSRQKAVVVFGDAQPGPQSSGGASRLRGARGFVPAAFLAMPAEEAVALIERERLRRQ